MTSALIQNALHPSQPTWARDDLQMDDTNCERLIRLADVPALTWLPTRNGKPIHVATIFRWASPRGLNGRRLRTARVGGAMVTTEAWLMDFCGLLDRPPAPVPTTRQRQRAIAKAERELVEAGIA